MNWFLDFPIPSYPNPISHSSKVLCLGSCFAEHMGRKLSDGRIDTLVNPFGILFHPLAILEILASASEGKLFDEKFILEREHLFFHFFAHSEIKATSRQKLIAVLKEKLEQIKDYLSTGSHLIITWGTAWVYELKEQNQIVANCHKQPGKLFEKHLLELEEMETKSKKVISALEKKYPNLKLILTLSPVRHTKDGIPENQLSKSLLRVLSQRLADHFPQVNYFPAYEIMMDELRDYRFYKEDKIHPSDEAINYIWKKFITAYSSLETHQKIRELYKIHQEIQHRPLNPESSEYRRFLAQLEQKLERLDAEFDFSKQLTEVRSQLNKQS